MNSLQGYFLIATPKMPDPRFQEQVVYLCAHNEDGAMGLVVNQPLPDIALVDILQSFDLTTLPGHELPPVYLGGPVETNTAYILYSSEYNTAASYLEVSPTVRLTREPGVLEDIARGKGPQKYLFLLGYAGWAPGQLENELRVDGWLTLPAEDEVLFDTPDEQKWHKAARKYGIDISVFGDVIGSA